MTKVLTKDPSFIYLTCKISKKVTATNTPFNKLYYTTAGHTHQQQNCEPKIMDTLKATHTMYNTYNYTRQI